MEYAEGGEEPNINTRYVKGSMSDLINSTGRRLEKRHGGKRQLSKNA